MKILRLILGDQLNENHSWFENVDSNISYVMAEMRQETDYTVHHIQKVMAFFGAMREFAEKLKKKGHTLNYYRIGDTHNPQNLPSVIAREIEITGAVLFEYQLPDEYRLDEQLRHICENLRIASKYTDTEHFFGSRNTLADFFNGKKQLLMESFYRMMRKKFGILMQGDSPVGGQWNFDHNNRKKWSGQPPVPPEAISKSNLILLKQEIEDSKIKTIGTVNAEAFPWPLTRESSFVLLEHFCRALLPYFGSYQDAMHQDESFLFHSRLSFSLNAKLISPAEVVRRVEQEYFNRPDEIHIAQAEGFIRQILGWREYMRGIYWREMPGYRQLNRLENFNSLPEFYWTGNTKMNCLKQAVNQSLKTAYAHHIQRLMITGNFALLIQVHPDAIDAWYLGIYIDALEWVEITNTRGMSQFADGGLLATKPYISSANYINGMSNYCKGCAYNPKESLGENACPFNALYWNFLHEKRTHLGHNPRMGMMYKLLDKKDPENLHALIKKASEIIQNPDQY